jgi:hypothetical protein
MLSCNIGDLMDKEIRYYEVELSFNAPTGAAVPITASSEEEASAIAQHLFKDYDNLKVTSVRDISNTPAFNPLLN